MSSDKKKKSNLLSLAASTLSAAIGVQSKSKLEEDFSQSSIMPFIVAGVLFTVLFLAALIIAAKLATN